jgi:exodeoxyribonuclease V gamma subunit
MVFETPHREWSELQKQIPFSISDQSIRQHSVLVSGFLKLLNLSKTRLVNQDVMDLLQIKEIRQSFEIEDEDLELINEWIKHAEIRWGRNAATRERDIGIAGFYQNSWEFGLERLMNGYAFDEELLYDESLSLPVGNDGLILGRLKRFMNHIYQLMDDFSTRQSTKVWSEILFGLLDVFIAKHDNNALERNVLVNAIQKLSDSWQVSSLTSELSSEMVIHSLESLLDEVSSTEGFLNRGVTFCAMLPMRSIPSKVVCLLGMNDGEFPRVDRRSGFDLMEKNWEQGDRSVRLNDRYIFLESLLSAQNVFYISYCGFNIKDNTVMEPSILVNELMQVLQEGENPFCIIHHPMHAYSPRYYNGELSSFSQKHFEMAMVLEGEKVAKKLICQEELSINEELQKNKVVSFQELINFFKHPSRYFLKYHLGTTFQTNELEELQKHEEFEPVTGLKKYNLKKEIHEKIKSGSAESLKQFYLATGRFSCGQKGELEIEQILDNMAQYQEQLLIDENDADERKLAVKINFDSTEFSIEGEIERVFENSYIPYSYSQDSPSKRLFELIPFLILSAGVGIREMKLHFSNKKLVLQSELTDQAKEDLRLLLDLYLEGLSKPLPFFPKGFEAFHGVMKSKGSEIGKAEAAARKKWLDSSSKNPQKPEGEDEVFKLCFGDLFPGDHPDFSERVWSTMKMLSDLLNRYSWSELK